MSQPTAPVLSFTFPIERAGNAIQGLPEGTYTIKITGFVKKLHKVAELAGALANTRFEDGGTSSEKRIYLDLTELEGLQFIGRWGTRFSRENSEYNGFRNASYLVSISLPLGIEFIGNDVFSGCTNLKELTIPYGVQAIGDNTFKGCSSLEKLQLPTSLRSIGKKAFMGCTSLKELVIPDGVESIGDNAFGGYVETEVTSDGYTKTVKREVVSCSSLEKLQLPATLRSIGKEAFMGCTSLKELVIPDSVESIGDNAFSGYVETGTVTTNGYGRETKREFVSCSNLEKLQLPASLRSIGKEAFMGYTSLKELVIPYSVESIGDKAFAECSSLEKIEMKGETPPVVYEESFPHGVTIYVPAASVQAYSQKKIYSDSYYVNSWGYKWNIRAIEENTEGN